MFRKLSSSPLPKTNQESQTLESVGVSQHETKASLNNLPNDLIEHLLLFTFLDVKDAVRVLLQVSKRTYAPLEDKSIYHQLEVHQKTKEVFQHLIRGEQDQVKAILEQAKKTNPDFLLSLLQTQLTITDHAKRQFDKITLFQLALWYLDRHMWEMLLKYLPKKEAAIQLQEHESGKASYVKEHGRHYDFEGPQGLVSAFENYVQLIDKPQEQINWEQVDQQWHKWVGGAQGQAPLHVIHEYCRKDVKFYPLVKTRFKEESLPREVDFYYWATKASVTFWEGLRSGLGTSFGLYRGECWDPARGWGGSPLGTTSAQDVARADFAAVSRLCQVRKEEYGLLKKALMLKQDSSQIEKEKKNAERPAIRLLPMNIPFAQDETDEKFRPAPRMINYTPSAPGTLFFGEQKTLPVLLCSQDSTHSMTSSHNMSALSIDEKPTTPAFFQLPVPAQVTKEVFQYLVRGEQDQVKAILEKAKKSNPNFLLALLKTQFTITDHAKRQFNKITLFQLALWYLDRHMWEMLLEYLPKEEAAIQLQEHESGKASYVKEHGHHYDFEGPKGLVAAIRNYVQLAEKPFEEINWKQADQQWQRWVGRIQGQAPLHMIHEYCRKDVEFYPLTETRFKEKTLPREVDFYNWITRANMTFWKGLRSGLGTSFGLYRGYGGGDGAERAGRVGGGEWGLGLARNDFAAVSRLCQVRKEEYGLLKKALILEQDSSQIEKEKKDVEKPDTCLLPMNIPFAQDEADEKFRPAPRMISYTTSAPDPLFFGEQKTLPVLLRSQDGAHRVTSSHNRSVLSIDEKPTTPAFFQLPVSAQITKNKVEEIGDKFTEAWTKLQPYLPNKQQFRELEQLVSQIRLNGSTKNEELIQQIQALQKKINDIITTQGGGFTSGISSMALMADGSPTKSYISGLVVDLYANILTLEELLLKQPKIKMSA